MSQHLVIGHGPAGAATARLLADQGESVRIVGRSERVAESGIEYVRLDASEVEALSEAAKDADVIYHCACPPYHLWQRDWPKLATAMHAAAESSGATLVVLSNLYGYGPVDGSMTEDLPLSANTVKGRVRAQVWERTRELHEQGRIRATELRASDFFGPRVTDGGHLASRAIPQLLAGKPVRVLGDPDSPHSWTYLPDVAKALVQAGASEDVLGRAWHVPTVAPRSSRQMLESLATLAGKSGVKVSPIPPAMLRVLGLFVPLMRELREIQYQFDRPFTVDSSAFTEKFGVSATPLEEQLESTLEWWRSRPAA
ncbi:NAD-dependent epimerase/dehydratase family protein [Sciscionella marina]|uniref:NAD-dependent epimerase/dehydratase family protein n=1 Tax=Sciscionella marina TaxID=508770 RepID=UPI00036D3DFB|nr:NAD-dependent epimerase/dehydratase family protein [Sciscionella marina]